MGSVAKLEWSRSRLSALHLDHLQHSYLYPLFSLVPNLSQFIIISLRNNMFEMADRLVGIYKTQNSSKSITINPHQFAAPAQLHQQQQQQQQLQQQQSKGAAASSAVAASSSAAAMASAE